MTESAAVYQRRRIVAVVAFAVVAVVLVFAITRLTGSDTAQPAKGGVEAESAQPTPTPGKLLELPRGGRTILPDFRVVAYYGAPQDRQLGILGIGKPSTAARRLEKAAKPFARKTRPVLPAMELIAVVAAGAPGPDGRYRMRLPDRVTASRSTKSRESRRHAGTCS